MTGRKAEIQELERLYDSGRPEFVAVYGRRRVGKTYLIKQTLKGRIAFQHTGVSPVDLASSTSRLRTQLESFHYSLLNQGLEGFSQPKTWMEAFYQLEQLLISQDNGGRQVVFIDELPWMDTPRSGFLSAFENFWNGWGSDRENLMLVICGSATSWILGNLVHSRGGLYGRLTYEIKLSPFTLGECEEYFRASGIEMSRYALTQSYMVFGGIPYYLGYFKSGLSFEQNTDAILFGTKMRLKDEFNRLFNAIFGNPEECKKIVRFLSTRSYGYTRAEISAATGIPLGGSLSDSLSALSQSDFIVRYVPFGLDSRTEHYKLIDNFCLFWLRFVDKHGKDNGFVNDHITSASMASWQGLAFEEVCWQHIDQIKRALGISGVRSTVSAWHCPPEEGHEGAQIDLLIEREDNVVNLCELKFRSGPYSIDKTEDARLRNRVEALKSALSPRLTIHLTLLTAFGLQKGKYSGIIQKELTMDDLFG